MGRSLHNHNLRGYLAGHLVSRTGQWVQQTAEIWLLLELTGSKTGVSMHVVLRYLPLLLAGAYGGVIVDRVDRRRLILVAQCLLSASVGVLAVVAWLGDVSVPLVYAVVAAQGLVLAVDNPARRSFLRDLSSDEELANAVSLQGSGSVLARTLGPATAAVLIGTVGIAACFTLNLLSFFYFIVVILRLDRGSMRPQVIVARAPRQLRDGLSYAWRHPTIRVTLILCAVVSTAAWNWTVLVPFYATAEFGGGSSLYGTFLTILGVGSVVGTLATARAGTVTLKTLLVLAGAVSVSLLAVSVSPVVYVAGLSLALLGGVGSAFTVAAQARLQLSVDDTMSGRILALFGVVFLGTQPLGGLLSGLVVDLANSRVAFAAAAVLVIIAVIALSPSFARAGGSSDPASRLRP